MDIGDDKYMGVYIASLMHWKYFWLCSGWFHYMETFMLYNMHVEFFLVRLVELVVWMFGRKRTQRWQSFPLRVEWKMIYVGLRRFAWSNIVLNFLQHVLCDAKQIWPRRQASHSQRLTHWDRVMHTCVGNLTIIGSDNGLSPGRCQAIMWNNAGILLIRSSDNDSGGFWPPGSLHTLGAERHI